MIALAESEPRKYLLPKNKVSFSSLRNFVTCPECWHRKYVLGEKGRMGISLPIGTSVHEGLAEARRLAAGFIDTADPLQTAADKFDEALAEIEPAMLDLGRAYPTEGDAKDMALMLVQRGIDRLIPEEVRRGIVEVEARPDFGDLLPFTVDGYIDVMLAGPTLLFKDLKTAYDSREPEGFSKAQLRFYTLPWHYAGMEVEMQIDTLPKTGKELLVHTAVESTEAGYGDVLRWVLHAAGQISNAMQSGDFPSCPGRFCDFVHEMAS